MDEKLTSRAKIIYDRDNNSPLFLRTAAFHIQHKDAKTAISILETGQQIFPNHPLSFILLGKAYHLLGDVQKTEAYLKKASDILDEESVYQYYKKELNFPEQKRSPFDSSRGNIFINSKDFDDSKNNEIEPVKNNSVDDNLKQIADQLMNARLDSKENFTSSQSLGQNYNPDKSKIASETLAKIYISQGQVNEAIKIYEQLAIIKPENKEYYVEKIKKLKAG